MATQHKEIDEQTLENLLYLSRLSPESTNMETLKKQVDDIVGYFDILSKYDDSENPLKKTVHRDCLLGFTYKMLARFIERYNRNTRFIERPFPHFSK